ncbi:MAG: ABC transporter permease, partial [Bacteroidetes bacterium]
MRLTYQIARRYLFSRKKSNAINIITWVSIGGIGVGTAALILV